MVDKKLAAPVAKLLELGEPKCSSAEEWLDYRALQIGLEHVPALISLATDLPLLTNSDENDARGWGPVHAWRALAQLRAAEAIDALITLFHAVPDNDWIIEEMPDVFAMIGTRAFAKLVAYLQDDHHPTYSRLVAATSLMQMALLAPEVRDLTVTVLAEQLTNYKVNSPGVNGVLIANLVELQAAEQAELIHRVFAESKVDRFIVGDWRDVRLLLTNNKRPVLSSNATSLAASIKKTPPDPTERGGEGSSARSTYSEPRTQPLPGIH